MIDIIHDDFKRTAEFHHNILLNLRVEYKTLSSHMQRDLHKWREWNLPEVHSAALNYYKNYALYLQYKIESHEKYHELFNQKSELLGAYIAKTTTKPSRFASVKSKIKSFLKSNKETESSDSETSNSDFSQSESVHTDTDVQSGDSSISSKSNNTGTKDNANLKKQEEDITTTPDSPSSVNQPTQNTNSTNVSFKDKNKTFDFSNNEDDPLLSELSISHSKHKNRPKVNITNLTHLNSIKKSNKKNSSIQSISKEEEAILLKANSIKIDEDIKLLEDNINSLQLVVDSLYIMYDKAKDHNKKLDPIERKKLLENILEDSSLACLPTAALNPLSAMANKNHIVIDGITYFPYNDVLYDRLDLFLKDKRYREGLFVDRWISLCKKNIVNLLNSKNTTTDFYNKLINETLRILKTEYSLDIVFPEDEQFHENKDIQTYFSILQLGVERFYFSRLKSDIVKVYNDNTGTSIELGDANSIGRFKRKQGLISTKLEKGEFDVIGIKKDKFTIQEYLQIFKEVMKEIETACRTSAPTDITYHLVNTVRLICEVLKGEVYGKDEGLSADSIFPYIVFVLVYTNVNNISEVFWYLEKVAEKKTRSGEMGVCVSMTHAATVWINEYEEEQCK
eukprot:GAHX01001566.1.p1 GENE.GAHX01001566.1~~GAHX01001566.1.p1  ORF type:complete len:622 (+),score=150.47 GAHX01001566.1:15-1880(+)